MQDQAVELAHRLARLPIEKRRLFHDALAQKGIDASILPIVPMGRDPDAGYAMSSSQERFWFGEELGGSGFAAHVAFGLRASGGLDAGALELALKALVVRHESLRTRFRRRAEGGAEQVVAAAGEAFAHTRLAHVDLSGLPAAEREAKLAALSAADAAAPFDLAAGPLLRATLVRLGGAEAGAEASGAGEHVLLVSLHHIICDGWSMRILVRDWLALYAAALRPGSVAQDGALTQDGTAQDGPPASDAGASALAAALSAAAGLPALPIQYADYALWQRARLAAGELDGELAHWRERLAGASAEGSQLPGDRPRPPVRSGRGGRREVRLPPDLAEAVRALARAEAATPVMVLLAAFAVLLYRRGAGTDLTLGVPAAGRTRAETEDLVGLFVNTQVLRLPVAGSAPFRTVLAAVREALIDAQAHQELPFERLVEALAPQRSLSLNPLVQVMYNHQPLALGDLPAGAGLKLAAFARESGHQPFDLALETTEEADGAIACAFGYASDLFRAATIERLAQDYRTLLAALTADTGAGTGIRAGDPALVPPAELDRLSAPWELPQVLTGSRVAAADLAHTPPVPELIGRRAQEAPQAPAVVCGDTVITYRELMHEARALARHLLHQEGVRPEDRIGVVLPRTARLVPALIGVLMAGAAFVPLEPGQPPARLAQVLAKAGATRVLVAPLPAEDEAAAQARLDALGEALSETGHPAPLLRLDRLPLVEADDTALPVLAPESLAYVIFTSGSTGEPKGVMVAHGPLARHTVATADLYGLRPGARELHMLSIAFDGAHERWMVPLSAGACVVLRGDTLWTAPETLAVIAKEAITHAGFPARYLDMLAAHAESAGLEPPEGGHQVELYSFGGEAMSRASLERIARVLRPRFLVNGYGPTEAVISPLAWKGEARKVLRDDSEPDPSTEGASTETAPVETAPVETAPVETAPVETAYVPIGRAVGARRAYVLDADLNPVPPGVTGEIFLAGDLARGYLARPADTAARFIPNPFPDSFPDSLPDPSGTAAGGRLYRTGDLGRVAPDGTVTYLGRADQQIKLRGFRIEPGEIEARLVADETVAEAAVRLADTPAGPRLLAYVVATPGATPDPAALRSTLARRLPDYMVPARIHVLDSIPLTPNGKLDTKALDALPTSNDADPAEPYKAPQTPTEQTLATIWQDILNTPQPISTNANFFNAGGDSLAALKMLGEIRTRLPGVRVSIADLFNNQDIASLAAVLDDDGERSCEVVHLRREGRRPMLYCFPGLMVNTREYAPLVKRLGEDQPATGFVCYSLAEERKKIDSVEAIAGLYASYVREHSAGERCFMLGWSWGGVLAFEAARMLEGEVDVGFVGMLDVCHLDVNFAIGALPAIADIDQRRLRRQVDAWLDRASLRKDWETLFAEMGEEGFTQFLAYVDAVGGDLPADGPGIGSREYELLTFLDNTLLYRRYELKPFDVPVRVWLAEESVKRGLQLVDWSHYSRKVERVEIIPGVTHREIVDSRAFHDSFARNVEDALKLR